MAIIETQKFIMTEVETNNNKWWTAELHDNGTYITSWGRVGYGNSSQTKSFSGGKYEMEKKIREKERKGYTKLKTIDAGVQVGASVVRNSDLHNITKSQLLKSSNPILERLVKRFVDSNVHKITANTDITYNSSTGLFATPLGVITLDGLTEARDILAQIAPFVRKGDYSTKLSSLVSSYLRIIPQNVGMKLRVENLLPNADSILKQNDLLDSLESSYMSLQNTPVVVDKTKPKVQQVFKVDLDVLNDTKERTRINKWFEDSKRSMHGYGHIKVREFYSVDINEMSSGFDHKLKPHQEVWHGTSEANCLSILKGGLKISPPSTAQIAGKLYGNGTYGSTVSSKSLGYSGGRWGQSSGSSYWLFVCEFAMGSIYYPNTYSASKPSNYDSLWAIPKNTGLHNDELVVYKNNQIKIKYLLECK